MTDETIKVTTAGEIQIDEVTLIANVSGGKGTSLREVDLKFVFAELNLFEDLFSAAMYGNILISDSNNLIKTLDIYGLEGLRIDVRTPGLSEKQRIRKTFAVYSITDQQTLHNDRLQIYRLHFCSIEMLSDAFTKPLNRPMPAAEDSVGARADELVPFIYNSYFAKAIPRNLVVKNGTAEKEASSDLVMGPAQYDYKEGKQSKYSNVYVEEGAESSNKIKFIATNWTPIKCINWIANRAVPNEKDRGGSFLFFESNKCFNFATIDSLIQRITNIDKFFYEYTPPNLQNQENESDSYSLDVSAQMRRVLKFEFVKAFNVLEQQQNGYFGQEIRSIDPIMKRYREHQYSYESHYEDFEHTDFENKPMFPNSPDYLFGTEKVTIDPRHHVTRRFRQPYFQFDDELTPIANHRQWLAQRVARMSSLSNFVLNLLVYGRTDMKVGECIAFQYPNMERRKPTDDATDSRLTGVYLVTAVRHHISPISHRMTLEVMRDSFREGTADTETTSPEMAPDP